MEYEGREAARFLGMRYLNEFKLLPREEQASIIAHYRTYHRVDGILKRKAEAEAHK